MQTLEVAIGLVAYFLLMSMVASAIVDIIEAKVRKKGRNLLKAVRTACGGGQSFTAALYGHPRVEILYEAEVAEAGAKAEERNTLIEFLRPGSSSRGLPAYIPNDTFARAFLETLTGCKVEELGDLRALFAEENRPWRLTCERSAEQLKAKGFLRELGRDAGQVVLQLENLVADELILDSDLDAAYRVMRPIIVEAGGDVDRSLELLGEHFEKVNERSKGWYKRWVTKCLFIIGLIIAFGTNGDTVRIVGRLNADPVLRASMLTLAESLEKQGVTGSQAGVAAVSEAKLQDKAKTGEQASPAVPPSAMSREQILKDLKTSEAISGGWANDPVLEQSLRSPKGWFGWLFKVLGLLATGAAISLGAPYWFHLLQTLLKLRGAFSGKGAADDKDEPAVPSVEQAAQAVEKVSREDYSPLKAGASAEVRRAAEFAEYSNLAYLTESEFRARMPSSEGWSTEFISRTVPKIDTQVFVLRNADRLVIVFRGTEPKVPADVITDLEFGLVDAAWLPPKSEARIHHGFAQALDIVWAELVSRWTPAEGAEAPKIVEFCGHSLGGALALLAAVRFAAESPENRSRLSGVFTIGQPRVGNAAFAGVAVPLLSGRYVRAVNNRDAVPRVPPQATAGTTGDYRHFGTVHYFDAAGLLSIDPSWFYRFLDYTLPASALKGATAANWISELKEAGTDHSSGDYAALYEAALCGAG
jgi:hypothetical protein